MCLAQALLCSSIIALPSTDIALHKHCLFFWQVQNRFSENHFWKTVFGKALWEIHIYKTMHEMHVETAQSNKIIVSMNYTCI